MISQGELHTTAGIQLSGNRSERGLGSCFPLMRGRVGLPDRSALVRRLVRKQFFDVDNVARLERRRLARIEDDAFSVSDPSDADRAFDADLDYAAGVLKLD